MIENKPNNKVTGDDFPDLVKKAEKFKKRALWLPFIITFLYFFIGLFVIVPSVFYLVGWSFSVSYPELPIAAYETEVYLYSLFLIFVVIWLLLDFLWWVFQKFFGMPKSEERVFASCFLIAKHLKNNEKEKALREVRDLITALKIFLKDRNKIKRRAYSKELKLLAKGKTQIQRMLLFSKDSKAELFTKFGLPFMKDEDQEAFSSLGNLLNELKQYGEPEGAFSGFVTTISQMKYLLIFLTALIEFIVAMLKVFGFF